MKLLPIIAGFALALYLPAAAQSTETPREADRGNVQLKLGNGSVVSGNVVYVSPDGRIVELRTASGSQPVWFGDIESVRRGKEDARWRKRPDPWRFRERYDPAWKDPLRWEFGFYGDYGFGVGRNGLDRYEVGLNLRYGLNQYLFVGAGVGINSIMEVNRIANSIFASEVNTTGCAVFANLRGYFRNRGIRPFADLRIGYNLPTSTYGDNQSRRFSDEGVLLRLSAGVTAIDRSDIAYSFAVGYHMHSVELTELNKDSFRRMSGSVALQFAVTFRW